VCNKEKCPREGKGAAQTMRHLTVHPDTYAALEKICIEQGLMSGPEYYPVPDYDAVLNYLIDTYSGRGKKN